MTAPSANTLYRATQALIRTGQPVFPCHPDGERAKRPRTKNGLHDATLDLPKVKNWWSRQGDSAIGIPTGIVWDVLDVDTKSGSDGREHLPYLQRLGLLNGCKRIVKTPSGGWHLYFKANPNGTLTNKANAALGLDVRSKGGYVLAPPSWIDDGDKSVGAYTDMGETTGSTDEPLWWDLILATLAPINTKTKKPIELLGYERRASLASLKGWLSEMNEGERNHALHWAACRCVDNGLDPHELMDAALLIGLGEEEVLKTIGSVLKRAELTVDDLDTEAEALFPEGE